MLTPPMQKVQAARITRRTYPVVIDLAGSRPVLLSEGDFDSLTYIQGGDGGETDIYAYVKLDGETVATAPLAITSYNNWTAAELGDLAVGEGQSLTVGVHVRCAGEGSGAWGMKKIACLRFTTKIQNSIMRLLRKY